MGQKEVITSKLDPRSNKAMFSLGDDYEHFVSTPNQSFSQLIVDEEVSAMHNFLMREFESPDLTIEYFDVDLKHLRRNKGHLDDDMLYWKPFKLTDMLDDLYLLE